MRESLRLITPVPLLLRHRWSLPAGYQPRLDRFPLPVPRDGLPVHLE
ncbi:hypothetical protein [Candidatus Frankia nodulisporulans]|nr:hypothetical protein [Candidatus Frankia nodulisporulans]